ncbi:MAG: hypothetical protein KGY99_08425 [Phycisphaerae bacterium]|nr:hypothetical protein [Phycisphaerae bacterium]
MVAPRLLLGDRRTYTEGMGQVIRFLKRHPWHRRLLTVALSVVLAAGAAVVLYPWVKQQWVIHRLGSERPEAFRRAVLMARTVREPSPALLDALSDALIQRLGSPEQSKRTFARQQAMALCRRAPMVERFTAALGRAEGMRLLHVALVLRDAGTFDPAAIAPERLDRLRALEAETAADRLGPYKMPIRLRELLSEAVIAARDNEYVRGLLSTCAAAESRYVRRAACLLAARIGADEVLGALLDDADSAVVASAALAAGAGGRNALYDAVVEHIADEPAMAAASSAWAAMRLRPAEAPPLVLAALRAADADANGTTTRRDALLHVAGMIGTPQARADLLGRLAAHRARNAHPPAALLLAAGRCNVTDAQREDIVGDVRATLLASREGNCTVVQMLAALEASRRLDADVLEEIVALLATVRNYAEVEDVLVAACRRAGELIERRPRDAAIRRRLEAWLVGLAEYYDPRTDSGTNYLTCPRASATAAGVLWRVQHPQATELLRAAIGGGTPTGADLAAWRAARARPAAALELGRTMLPPVDAAPDEQVHNARQRAAGAVLLGLAPVWSAPEQRAARRATAEQRLRSLLSAGRSWGERDPDVRRAIHGALAALGGTGALSDARAAFRDAPGRRTLTPLLVAGDRWVLDRLLIRATFSDRWIDTLLTGEGAGEVLSETAGRLPRVDAAATADVRLWQVRILRAVYALSGRNREIGL